MKYELILTYDDGMMKKERASLANIMGAMGIYMEDNSWVFAQIMNCTTGEIVAHWTNDPNNGITIG